MTVRKRLQQDWQWTRACRIAHARYQLVHAINPKDKAFWQQVISANKRQS